MQATPATWRMLVDAGWSGGRAQGALRWRSAARPLADELVPRCAELWNMYGPTETTIWSLGTRLAEGEPVTIGTSDSQHIGLRRRCSR